MKKIKIRDRDLKKLGYQSAKAVALGVKIARAHYNFGDKKQVLDLFYQVLHQPDQFMEDLNLSELAKMVKLTDTPQFEIKELKPEAPTFPIYGLDGIGKSAVEQMDLAMRLPIALEGALMPDAHHGYGLPVGGVLATENAVIPYGVGMDIGCRMSLTVYDLGEDYLYQQTDHLREVLKRHTRFGKDAFEMATTSKYNTDILDRPEFNVLSLPKKLKNKAYQQLGSSGSGNHFVEFGVVEITEKDDILNLEPGKYLGLLSHSGSRGFGAMIAQHYTKLAKDRCRLPKEAQHLAWLDLDSEAGEEYWLSMNLAGDYASACHHHIHARISEVISGDILANVENHHNFAWKETLANGKEAVVHRKGATPAGKDVLGIIPGSMTAPGFIVKGKGYAPSLNSASHGAGRQLSRTKAKQATTFNELRKTLKKAGVRLIGGGIDEAPMAYKDIHQVMGYQRNLVDVLGSFLPKIVRMDS